jgi:hypothetical protein
MSLSNIEIDLKEIYREALGERCIKTLKDVVILLTDRWSEERKMISNLVVKSYIALKEKRYEDAEKILQMLVSYFET